MRPLQIVCSPFAYTAQANSASNQLIYPFHFCPAPDTTVSPQFEVMMGSGEMDSSKWNCNNLSSMFGNWGFLFLVYIMPLLFPDVGFLTLSAMMFLFAEVLMHLILFNVKLGSFYNPGFVTAVFGMGPIGLCYFMNVFDAQLYAWHDYALAVAWFVAAFLFSFRSKLYWGLGKKEGYALADQSAYGIK